MSASPANEGAQDSVAVCRYLHPLPGTSPPSGLLSLNLVLPLAAFPLP